MRNLRGTSSIERTLLKQRQAADSGKTFGILVSPSVGLLVTFSLRVLIEYSMCNAVCILRIILVSYLLDIQGSSVC